MPGFIGSVSVLAPVLLGLVSAVPVANPKSASTSNPGYFSVSNSPTGNTVQRNGKAALLKAYTKHAIAVPDHLANAGLPFSIDLVSTDKKAAVSSVALGAPAVATSAAAIPAPGSDGASASGESGQVGAVAKGNGDVEFLSQISIGGQPITMDFDTGSSDLWVFNTQTQSNEGHTLYDPSKSSTWKPMDGSAFQIKYGDQSMTAGNLVGTDVVNVGGASYAQQVIELPSTVSAQFMADTSSNGLVGLAFSSLNTVKPTPAKGFFENISPQLAQPVFTANLKHAANGTYNFGRIDNSEYKGNLVFTAVDNSLGYWGFQSNTFAIGNGQSITNSSLPQAIADTGTSLLLMADQIVNSYYAQVKGAVFASASAGYIFPCDSKLPDLKLALGTTYMNTIPGSLLNYTPVNSTYCFGGLQSAGVAPVQILGDILFKAQFVAFHMGNMQIGFADHA